MTSFGAVPISRPIPDQALREPEVVITKSPYPQLGGWRVLLRDEQGGYSSLTPRRLWVKSLAMLTDAVAKGIGEEANTPRVKQAIHEQLVLPAITGDGRPLVATVDSLKVWAQSVAAGQNQTNTPEIPVEQHPEAQPFHLI